MPISETGLSGGRFRRASGRQPDAGFTLIEILVVVTIIGIFIGVAVFSTDLVNFDRQMQQEARRMESLLRLASEDAVLQSQDYGLKVYENGYEFLVYDHGAGIWRPREGDSILVRQMLDDMTLELRVEDREVELEPAGEMAPPPAAAEADDDAEAAEEEEELLPVPEVVIYSSGEFTPFEVGILNAKALLDPAVVLSVEFDGKTEIGRSEP